MNISLTYLKNKSQRYGLFLVLELLNRYNSQIVKTSEKRRTSSLGLSYKYVEGPMYRMREFRNFPGINESQSYSPTVNINIKLPILTYCFI